MPIDPQNNPAHCEKCEREVPNADHLDEAGRCAECRAEWRIEYCTCGHPRYMHGRCEPDECSVADCDCKDFEYDSEQDAVGGTAFAGILAMNKVLNNER